MPNYTAGSLDLSIIGYSDSVVASIDRTASALRKLYNSLSKMEGISYAKAGNKLIQLFERIATASNSINTTNLQNLASAAKSLSSISKIQNFEKMDYTKIADGFSKLTVAITPFINKVKEAEASLTALYGVVSKSSGKKMASILNAGGEKQGGLFNTVKLATVLYLAKRIGGAVQGIVQAGSDYLETMNLWQVAMRENLDLADEFVNKMNRAYGVSAKTTMQAQATFKNMIGSLGDLSDETAYRLSEAITQMAFDYSSLYNVKLQSAVEKFQSALAGQVRPIRSVSGYDITEKTIHALYQSIGGTKTQRQLSRTEKQLLAILAIYRQMGASGALGDMAKTLDQFANQSRMMTEYWIELKSWTGLVLKDFIDQSGVLVFINALLITFTGIMKAIAKSKGLGEENFVDGIFESAEGANEEVDELQGKLLDFDKFRSLSGEETGADIAIDQKLLDALSGYESQIDNVISKAQQLADEWGKFWFTEEGTLTPQAEALLDVLELIGITIVVLIGKGLIGWIGKIAAGFMDIKGSADLLNTALISGVIFAIIKAIEAFKEGDIVGGIIATTIGVVLVGALVAFKIAQQKSAMATQLANLAIEEQNILAASQAVMMNKSALAMKNLALAALGIVALTVGIVQFVHAWDDMSGWQKAIGIFAALAGAIAAAAIAIKVFHMDWAGAIGVAGLVAGGALAVTSAIKIPNYENGASDIDSGTVFRAGEFGKTEAVYTGDNGKTNVANVRQMEQAFYNALSRYGSENGGTIVVETYLDGEKVYQNTTAKAKAKGKVWANA